jgi:asparagine synthase (glutamine-hydrolysing)
MALAARGLPPNARGRGYLELLASGAVERYFRMVTDQRRPPLTAMLTPEAQKHLGERIDGERFRRLATASGAPDYVATLQAIDIETYLPEDILTKVDRASMLVSLEARVPLLDRPLMEFLASMPSTLKLRDGLGKQVLRDVMAGLLPGAVVTRSKMGFAVPLGRWFRSELNDYTRDLLLCTTARARGILDPEAVERLLAEHESGGRDLSSQIWTLLCLEQWSRQWGSA